MAAVDAELLAAVERSPAATDIHDRSAWLGLFTPDARVEDPYGSRPHVGADEIGRFYDTFIGPRRIVWHRDIDLTAGATVVRDLVLEIDMAPGVTLDVPMHLRYDLRPSGADWDVERLRAHWELPTMVGQMLRSGARSVPVSIRLGGELLRNQGVGGTAGFVSGFRRPGRRQKRCVQAFLDAATSGDEGAAHRALTGAATVTRGDGEPLTVGDFVERIHGGRWFKMIAAGDTVSASVATPTGRGVVFCSIPRAARRIGRLRYFATR